MNLAQLLPPFRNALHARGVVHWAKGGWAEGGGSCEQRRCELDIPAGAADLTDEVSTPWAAQVISGRSRIKANLSAWESEILALWVVAWSSNRRAG